MKPCRNTHFCQPVTMQMLHHGPSVSMQMLHQDTHQQRHLLCSDNVLQKPKQHGNTWKMLHHGPSVPMQMLHQDTQRHLICSHILALATNRSSFQKWLFFKTTRGFDCHLHNQSLFQNPPPSNSVTKRRGQWQQYHEHVDVGRTPSHEIRTQVMPREW